MIKANFIIFTVTISKNQIKSTHEDHQRIQQIYEDIQMKRNQHCFFR